MVAIIHKHKPAVVDLTLEISGFLAAELNQLMSAQITKWVIKKVARPQFH